MERTREGAAVACYCIAWALSQVKSRHRFYTNVSQIDGIALNHIMLINYLLVLATRYVSDTAWGNVLALSHHRPAT